MTTTVTTVVTTIVTMAMHVIVAIFTKMCIHPQFGWMQEACRYISGRLQDVPRLVLVGLKTTDEPANMLSYFKIVPT